MDGRESEFADAGQSHRHGDSRNAASSQFQSFPSSDLETYDPFRETSNTFSDLDYRYATLSNPHLDRSVSPDNFYKSYQPLDLDDEADMLSMATSSIPRPSLRSNGDGSTPRHPPLPSSTRSTARSTARSASNPADTRPPANRAISTSRVSDLKKRFDQNGSNAPPVPGTTRGSTNQTSSRAQRSKFVSEDTVSSNVHSFASRIGKPRNSPSGNLIPSTPSDQAPPQFSRSPSSPSAPRSQGLLFGEILPERRDPSAVGYGIDGYQAADVQGPQSRQRSLSHVDIPSGRHQETASDYHVVSLDQVVSHAKSSFGSSSDATVAASGVSSHAPLQRPPTRPPTAGHRASSKLPVPNRRRSSQTDSTDDPSSTRSSSPAALKRNQANGNFRSTTSSSSNNTAGSRAKTPTRSRGNSRAGAVTPNDNTRLQAYVPTPPKLSPPLRSSRPRQPVSMATTASSRMKMVDKHDANGSGHRKGEESGGRRRKISVGPIDFEQRREHIRLAYSRSIREKQAEDARQRAVQRRQRELEAAARAKAAAEAAIDSSRASSMATAEADTPKQRATVEANEPSPFAPLNQSTETSEGEGEGEGEGEKETHIIVIDPPAEVPRPVLSKMTTSEAHLAQEAVQAASHGPSVPLDDSPELGLPGAFPLLSPPRSSRRPMSSVSIDSDTTEFDTEPQTSIFNAEPAQSPASTLVPITLVKPPSPSSSTSARDRAHYQYPFAEDPDSPVHSALSSMREHRPSFSIPGAFDDVSGGDDDSSDESRHNRDETIRISMKSTTRRPSIPFPRIDRDDDSDCHSSDEDHLETTSYEPHQHAQPPYGDVVYSENENENENGGHGQDDSGDCDSNSQMDSSHLVRQAPSSCASENADEYGQVSPSQEANVDFYTPDGLSIPSAQPHRSSHQSAWTDYSINSQAASERNESPIPDSPTYGHVTIFNSSSHGDDTAGSTESAGKRRPRSRPSVDSIHSVSYFKLEPEHHELPREEHEQHGDKFSVPVPAPVPPLSRDSDGGLSYVPSPIHEPPPIPFNRSGLSRDDSRASSAYYDESHNSSGLFNSERASEDFSTPSEARPTTDATSVEPSDRSSTGGQATAGGDEPRPSLAGSEGPVVGKERQRLVKRLHVIKELVDTEAVFVRDMNIVEEIYKGTAEACPKLDDKTVKIVFRNTEDIIAFHTAFLALLKEAVVSIYVPKGGKSREGSVLSESSHSSGTMEVNEADDRTVLLGPVFNDSIEKMKAAHEGFLRNSDQAAKTLIQIQQDPAVKLWLSECNEVAKDLTAAWDLDSLLIKPMQRITKYPNLIMTLLQETPQDHPDREQLISAKETLETAIIEINQTKKNFELVGQIVGGRKRKDSEVRAGFARAFGKRVDKLQTPAVRPPEDANYAKLSEKFGDDFLRLQVVLRDVEFYTRQVTSYVHEFLQFLSSIELIMRLHPGSYPELESKWVQFNISVRDLENVALEEHLNQVRKRVIEPFELVIKSYANPNAVMKKRQKRRLDFERFEQLKKAGKGIDSKLKEQVEQYEALNATLIKELPKLSSLTEKVGMICLGNFVDIQTKWYGIWRDKMKLVLGDCSGTLDLQEIVSTFQRDFPYAQDQLANITILDPAYRGRPSQSTSISEQDVSVRVKTRPAQLDLRGRVHTLNGDFAPTLPTPDFLRRSGEGFSVPSSADTAEASSPSQYYYRDYYANIQPQPPGSGSVPSPEVAGSSSRSLVGTGLTSTRPSTGRSYDSGGLPRPSMESGLQRPRDSNTTFSSHPTPQDSRPFSGMFQSALPPLDSLEDSRRSSQASPRDRDDFKDGYHVLWLAASLFEFNISTTKHEAGYPYLVYQAGEIFDVIAEKGELWLAKNQDDPTEKVGWIWSKHFAKLADS